MWLRFSLSVYLLHHDVFHNSYSAPPLLRHPYFLFTRVPSTYWIQEQAASRAASRVHAPPPRYPPLLLLMVLWGIAFMLDAERWCVAVGQKIRRRQLLRWVGGSAAAYCPCSSCGCCFCLRLGKRNTGSRQPIRAGEEGKKTRLDIFLKPLEICEIKGRS